MTAHPSRELPLCWEQHCKLLPGVVGVPASRVALWTVDEVSVLPTHPPSHSVCVDSSILYSGQHAHWENGPRYHHNEL